MARLVQLLFALPLVFLPLHGVPGEHDPVDRAPAVAGAFYPASSADLAQMVNGLLSHAVPSNGLKKIIGLIVPHAGYVYSGQVAASGFNQIDTSVAYQDVFIIGPSHYVDFTGAAVYTAGDFATPLGVVPVDRALSRKLVAESALFTNRTDVQEREHSVEVEIPFLQHLFGNRLKIVPIVVGANAPDVSAKIASVLRPYFTARNLFVISSDFSHYPAYNDAIRADSATAAAIMSNSPATLQRTLIANDRAGIPNLATSLCGWSAVMTFLSLTSNTPSIKFEKIQSMNSGDSPVGSRDRVVGYCTIVAYEGGEQSRSQGFQFTSDDKAALLAIARQTLEHNIRTGGVPDIPRETLSASLKSECGAFVTLNKNGRLRGCIGRFEPDAPLYQVIQEMTVAAATQDYRFSPVTRSELNDIRIEVSVLTPLRKIRSDAEFDPARNGIYIRKGNRSGTFLPQVARETGWTKEELLGHCAQDKAGIGWDGWKDADLYVYDAIVFGE